MKTRVGVKKINKLNFSENPDAKIYNSYNCMVKKGVKLKVDQQRSISTSDFRNVTLCPLCLYKKSLIWHKKFAKICKKICKKDQKFFSSKIDSILG